MAHKLEIYVIGVSRSLRTIGIYRTKGSEWYSMGSPSMRYSLLFVLISIDGAQPSTVVNG